MSSRADRPLRIGVVKPCCIGDTVMALPAIDSLAAEFPDAELRLFVGAHSRPVVEGRGDRWMTETIDDTISVSGALSLAWTARARRLDLVVVLERSRILRTAIALRVGARVAAVTVVEPEIRHESVAYLDVLRGVGIAPAVTRPTWTPTPEEAGAARAILDDYERPVLIHPGGAENPGVAMPDKRWPADRYVELVRALESDGYSVVFSGGARDEPIVDHIIVESGVPARRSLAGTIDLRTAAAVAAEAQLFVGGDTGMAHIAAATGTPVISIFGPTNPRRYRPLGDSVTVLAPPDSWNVPDTDLRRDVGDSRPRTDDVAVADVVAACRQALQAPVLPA